MGALQLAIDENIPCGLSSFADGFNKLSVIINNPELDGTSKTLTECN
jgi:hypothetical protein